MKEQKERKKERKKKVESHHIIDAIIWSLLRKDGGTKT